MQNAVTFWAGKTVELFIKLSGLGAGGTWPGEIALNLDSEILVHLFKQLKCGLVIVAGTNGKTTTSLMVKHILEKQGYSVIHNASGANLLNGIVSAFIKQVDWMGRVKADWGVFEVDENSLPAVISQIVIPATEPESDPNGSRVKPGMTQNDSSRLRSNNKRLIIVLLNLFRDQLDRYGEVDVVAEKWQKALRDIILQPSDFRQHGNTTFVLNADDPLIAHLGKRFLIRHSERSEEALANASSSDKLRDSSTEFILSEVEGLGMTKNVVYFGINDKSKFLKDREHATDSTFCLNCGSRLTFAGVYFSHLGVWKCQKCGEKRPTPAIAKWDSPLPGLYNLYNTLAAVSVAKSLNISDNTIKQALNGFMPAFGRQEEFSIDAKRVKIFLSKNPAGFNASLRTVLELNPKVLLLALNDRIPDGRDVSWIWDVDLEMIPKDVQVFVSGDRTWDLAVRMKYAPGTQNLKIKNQNYNSKFKNLIVEPELEKAIIYGLNQIENKGLLYVLPTYSAMLEVRKILTGRKIL